MSRKQLVILTLLLFLLLPSLALALGRGQKVSLFSGRDLNGKTIDMSRLIGKKPVMLVFWASWCPSCREEVPKINKLYKKYHKEGMAFIGINVGYNDSVARAQAFVRKTGMAFPVIFDERGKITRMFAVQGVPTVFVADRNGVIRYKNYGLPTMSDQDFQKLLAN
ncbi:MAG TPA: TlpA family protein disulfide reductase [Desulfobulbus sp.]|nr:TlpA family protein disulfide reductase [Desulfobulbus sp.]